MAAGSTCHLPNANVTRQPEYIDAQALLYPALSYLNQAATFAFDLEFDRDRFGYGFRLCLVQIATEERCFLIDPLACTDLTTLFQLFESDHITKIVHCPGEDLRLLHASNCFPKKIVDTEIFAKLLDFPQTSLSAMLQETLNVELDKRWQKSNWAIRPLLEEQLAYAAKDVLYLHDLYARLQEACIKKGILELAEEEQQLLNELRFEKAERTSFLKKSDVKYLSPHHQHMLQEMLALRDAFARELNKPPQFVIPEANIRRLVIGDMSLSDFQQSGPTLPALQRKPYQQRIIATWQNALDTSRQQQLSHKRPGNGVGDAVTLVERRATQYEIREKVFLPIQKHISNRLGEHAARFVFSSGFINDVIQGEVRLGQIKAAYRRRMIEEAAQQLDIDITPWW